MPLFQGWWEMLLQVVWEKTLIRLVKCYGENSWQNTNPKHINEPQYSSIAWRQTWHPKILQFFLNSCNRLALVNVAVCQPLPSKHSPESFPLYSENSLNTVFTIWQAGWNWKCQKQDMDSLIVSCQNSPVFEGVNNTYSYSLTGPMMYSWLVKRLKKGNMFKVLSRVRVWRIPLTPKRTLGESWQYEGNCHNMPQ